jgi:hypothetical protein
MNSCKRVSTKFVVVFTLFCQDTAVRIAFAHERQATAEEVEDGVAVQELVVSAKVHPHQEGLWFSVSVTPLLVLTAMFE